MTQAEFDRLPGLLRLHVFMEATGLDKHTIYALVKAGELEVWRKIRTWKRARGRGKRQVLKCRYYKREAARLAGFRF